MPRFPRNSFKIDHPFDYFSQPKLDAEKIIQDLGKSICGQELDLVIDSFSFDIDSAFKVVDFLKRSQINYRIWISRKCGSFATVLALGASQVCINSFGALSPIDPVFYSHGFPTIRGKKQFWHFNPLEYRPWMKYVSSEFTGTTSKPILKFCDYIQDEVFPPEKRTDAENYYTNLKDRLLNIVHPQYEEIKSNLVDFFLSGLNSFDASAYFSQLKEVGMNAVLSSQIPHNEITRMKNNTNTKNKPGEVGPIDEDYKKRKDHLHEFLTAVEREFSSAAILLYTPTCSDFSGQITHSVEQFIQEQLYSVKRWRNIPLEQKIPKLTLVLSTSGGNYPASINTVKLIRENSEVFETLVMDHAYSAGSLICALSDKVWTAKSGKFGTFSPLVNSLTEQGGVTIGISDIEEMLSDQHSPAEKAALLNSMYNRVDPITIAQAFRAKNQIQSSLGEFLKNDNLRLEKIVSCFLDKNKSHEFFISAQEALEGGLPIEFISSNLEEIIRQCSENLVKITVPYASQDLKTFYQTQNNDSLSFSLVSLLVCSIYGGITSTKTDFITVYSGERKDVPLNAISIQPSLQYSFREEI